MRLHCSASLPSRDSFVLCWQTLLCLSFKKRWKKKVDVFKDAILKMAGCLVRTCPCVCTTARQRASVLWALTLAWRCLFKSTFKKDLGSWGRHGGRADKALLQAELYLSVFWRNPSCGRFYCHWQICYRKPPPTSRQKEQLSLSLPYLLVYRRLMRGIIWLIPTCFSCPSHVVSLPRAAGGSADPCPDTSGRLPAAQWRRQLAAGFCCPTPPGPFPGKWLLEMAHVLCESSKRDRNKEAVVW